MQTTMNYFLTTSYSPPKVTLQLLLSVIGKDEIPPLNMIPEIKSIFLVATPKVPFTVDHSTKEPRATEGTN